MWWRMESRAPRHPKVLQVLMDREWGAKAFAWWVCAGSYCVEQLTDGAISDAVAGALMPLHGDEVCDVVRPLMDAGLLHKDDCGYRVHDYLDWQPSAREVRKAAKQRVEAGRVGGLAKAKRSPSGPPASRQNIALAKPCPETESEIRDPKGREGEGKEGAVALPPPAAPAPQGEGAETSLEGEDGAFSEADPSPPAAATRRTWITDALDAYLSALNRARAGWATDGEPAPVEQADLEQTDIAAFASYLRSTAGKGKLPDVAAVRMRLEEWLAQADPQTRTKGFLRLRDFVAWHKRRRLAPPGPQRAGRPDAKPPREDVNAAWVGRPGGEVKIP